MSSLIEATKYKAATCPRKVQQLSWWLDDFTAAENKRDGKSCKRLTGLAVNAGLLTKGEALAFYKRAGRIA